MAIMSDKWFKKNSHVIQPFINRQVKDGCISYGLSSFGYDIRCENQFTWFIETTETVLDPKNLKEAITYTTNYPEGYLWLPAHTFVLTHSVETITVPEDVLVLCTGKSTYARCFSADTKIKLTNEEDITFLEAISRVNKGEKLYGYGVKDGEIIVQELVCPRKVEKTNLVEITLDNNEKIRCTKDHKFLLRNGLYKQAQYLTTDDSLMPNYLYKRNGYNSSYNAVTRGFRQVSHLVWEYLVRHGKAEQRQKTEHIHHKDENKLNNIPSNLVKFSNSEYITLHNYERYKDFPKKIRRTLSQASKEAWQNCDITRRIKQQEIMREINIRKDITEETVSLALLETGTIRGAARKLNVDRTAFRRFPHIIQNFKQGILAYNHKIISIKHLDGIEDVYCLTAPETGNFALSAGVFVSNCGLIVNTTPLEPGWKGQITLELSNTTDLPIKVYANEGIAQLLFIKGGQVPDVIYAARQGKYQDQVGVTLPRC